MGDVFKQNFSCVTCQHCGEITNISLGHDWRQLVGKYKTLKELLILERANLLRLMNLKNCQIECMHKTIAQTLGLLNEEQKVKAKEINQEMRDYLNKSKKEVKK